MIKHGKKLMLLKSLLCLKRNSLPFLKIFLYVIIIQLLLVAVLTNWQLDSANIKAAGNAEFEAHRYQPALLWYTLGISFELKNKYDQHEKQINNNKNNKMYSSTFAHKSYLQGKRVTSCVLWK